MRWLLLLTTIVVRLSAGPIDPVPVEVTNSNNQWLNNADKLLFTISDWPFGINAAERGMSPYPVHGTFNLLSLPQVDAGDFAAWWAAADGSVVANLPGTISWLRGRYQSSGYTGPVSVLYGSIDFPPNSDPAMLVIENLGDPVNIGLPTYTLQQDLTVSFSNGGFGVSGMVTQIQYLDPPVPEPHSGWILLVAGAGLCVTPRLLNRKPRLNIE